MSYPAIVAGLVADFAAVPGIKHVLDYEPTAIQDTPMLYLLLDTADRARGLDGHVKTTYRLLGTLVIRWQDNEGAEGELVDLLDGVLGALDADPTLGGLNGQAEIVSADAGYGKIGATLYRIVELGIEAVESACI